MIRGAISLGVGLVAGYSLARAIECRAQGVPLSEAFGLSFAKMLTPVSRLGGFVTVSPAGRRPALTTSQDAVDPDAVLSPSFAQ